MHLITRAYYYMCNRKLTLPTEMLGSLNTPPYACLPLPHKVTGGISHVLPLVGGLSIAGLPPGFIQVAPMISRCSLLDWQGALGASSVYQRTHVNNPVHGSKPDCSNIRSNHQATAALLSQMI